MTEKLEGHNHIESMPEALSLVDSVAADHSTNARNDIGEAFQYSDNDREQWGNGAKIFSQLCSELHASDWESFRNPYTGNLDLEELKGFLIGEKAMFSTETVSQNCRALLESHGYFVGNSFIFNPRLVVAFMSSHPEVSQSIPVQNPQELMQFLDSREISPENEFPAAQGLLFGYPLPEVLEYARFSNLPSSRYLQKLVMKLATKEELTTEESEAIQTLFGVPNGPNKVSFVPDYVSLTSAYAREEGVSEEVIQRFESEMIEDFTTERIGVNAGGCTWSYFGKPSEESLKREHRLRAAFAFSSIDTLEPPLNTKEK